MVSVQYSVSDLLYLMQRLRTPETGCPWDLEQNYLSITPSTIEEAYEVVDAIEQEDFAHLREELGDLLFQVVFYAQLAKEENRFDFDAVVHEITAKLIRRHPHVFPDGTLSSVFIETEQKSSAKVLAKWEAIKQQERQGKGHEGLLDDVPLALPALQRAQKIQKRVAKAGMDWSSADAVLEKLQEEIAELREAIALGSKDAIKDEMGDVLFTCVNVARHLQLDADQALRASSGKFEARINTMTKLMANDDVSWQELNASQLDQYWNTVKGT